MKISNKVVHVKKHILAFTLTLGCSTPRGAANTHLNIRAFINPKMKWPEPNQHLLCPNCVVSFAGNLICVFQSVAVIALDDITLLWYPGTLHTVPQGDCGIISTHTHVREGGGVQRALGRFCSWVLIWALIPVNN